MWTLVKLDDFADRDGGGRRVIRGLPATRWGRGCIQQRSELPPVLSQPRRPGPAGRKSSLFCQHLLDLTLDTHRHKGKNTHELIVLPAGPAGSTGRPGIAVKRLLGGLLW